MNRDTAKALNEVFPYAPGRSCVYCGSREGEKNWLQKDHFVPRCAGGSDDPSNIVIACPTCNGAKGRSQFQSIEDCRLWLHYRAEHCDKYGKGDRFTERQLSSGEIQEAKLLDQLRRNWIANQSLTQEQLENKNLEWGSL